MADQKTTEHKEDLLLRFELTLVSLRIPTFVLFIICHNCVVEIENWEKMLESLQRMIYLSIFNGYELKVTVKLH